MSIISSLLVKIGVDTSDVDKGIGSTTKAVAAGLGILAVGAGKALYDIGGAFDDMADTIRVGTGATGKELEKLNTSAQSISTKVPASFDDIGIAVADVNTRLGLTGKPLEAISAQFLELSRITGTDLKTNIASVSRVFGDWGVATKDQAGAMDFLFKVSQNTGIGVDELSKQVVTFGAPLRQLGFDFETSAAMLGKWEKEGVNANAVLAGMKIGLGKFSKAGQDPVKAMSAVTAAIKGAGSAGKANQIAIETFGQRAGPDMAAAIREGRFDLDELMGTLKGSKETIMGAGADTMDFAEKWQMFKNKVLVGIEPLATRVFAAIGDGMSWIEANGIPTLTKFGDWFSSNQGKIIAFGVAIVALTAITAAHAAATAIAAAGGMTAWITSLVRASAVGKAYAAVQWLINAAMSANPIGLIVVAIAALVAGLVLAYQRSETFRDIVNEAFSAIMGVVGPVLDWLKSAVVAVIDFVRNNWQLMIGIIAGPIGVIVALIITNWGAIKSFLSTVLNAIKSVVSTVWNAIKSAVSSAVNAVKAVVTTVFAAIRAAIGMYVDAWRAIITTAWNVIRNVVSAGVNAVRSVISTVFGAIRGFIGNSVDGWRNVISTAWNVIRNVVSTAVNAVRSVVSDVFGAIRSVVSSTTSAARSAVTEAWNRIRSATSEVFGALKGIVTTAVNGVMTVISGIKARVLGVFAGAASWLVNAGRSILDGLVSGIESAIGKVRDKLSSVTDMIPDWKGPAKRDAVLLKPAGRLIMKGLIDGLTGELGKLESTLGRVTDLIEKTMSKRFKNDKMADAATKSALRGIASETAALMANAKARERVAGRLDAARDKLKDAIEQSRSYAASVRDQVVAFGDITQFVDQEAGTVTASQVVTGLQAKLEAAKKYATALKQLMTMGLNETALEQIKAKGVEGGLATAQALVDGGPDTIAQINDLTGQLVKVGGNLGDKMADTLYGAGIDSAQALVDSLESKMGALEAVGQRLAQRFTEALRKELGGQIAGRVDADIDGAYTRAVARTPKARLVDEGSGKAGQRSRDEDVVEAVRAMGDKVTAKLEQLPRDYQLGQRTK